MSLRAGLVLRFVLGASLAWPAVGCEKSRLRASLDEYRRLTSESMPDERRVAELARFVERRPNRKTNPHVIQACTEIGRHHARAGNVALAAAWFERAVALSPDDPTLLNLAGYHYAEHETALPRAIEMLSRAVALGLERGYTPRQMAFFKDSLGWALRGKGELRRAVALLSESRDLAPDVAIIAEHLEQARRELAAREEGTGRDPSVGVSSGAAEGGKLDVGGDLEAPLGDGDAPDVEPGADGAGVDVPQPLHDGGNGQRRERVPDVERAEQGNLHGKTAHDDHVLPLLRVVLDGQLRFENLIDRDRRAANGDPEARLSLFELQVGGIAQDEVYGREARSDRHGIRGRGAQQLEQG